MKKSMMEPRTVTHQMVSVKRVHVQALHEIAYAMTLKADRRVYLDEVIATLLSTYNEQTQGQVSK
jgi:hypothetical protein